jgi:apolipoprotein N-acyltransferase
MGALAVLLALGVFGQLRLDHNPTRTYETPVYMRLVQPSIDPNEKWNHNQLEDILLLQMNLSRLQPKHKLAAIIWPEAAVPLAINQEPYLRQGLATIVPTGGVLITGSVLREPAEVNATGSVLREPAASTGSVSRKPEDMKSTEGSNPSHVQSAGSSNPSQPTSNENRYSALVALDETGTLVAAHRKAHLLPFGEYAPFRKWLPIEKFTPGAVDYSEGPGIKTTHVKGLPPFAPLLCFEAVFSGEVTEKVMEKVPEKNKVKADPSISSKGAWLLNLTNDAWYQDSIGLQQHLAHVRLRAIEEGLPMVRSANNGISAVIDGAGRILKQLKANQIGVLDFELPRPLNSKNPSLS